MSGDMMTSSIDQFIDHITKLVDPERFIEFTNLWARIGLLQEDDGALTCDLNTYFQRVEQLREYVLTEHYDSFNELVGHLKGSLRVWSNEARDFVPVYR